MLQLFICRHRSYLQQLKIEMSDLQHGNQGRHWLILLPKSVFRIVLNRQFNRISYIFLQRRFNHEFRSITLASVLELRQHTNDQRLQYLIQLPQWGLGQRILVINKPSYSLVSALIRYRKLAMDMLLWSTSPRLNWVKFKKPVIPIEYV